MRLVDLFCGTGGFSRGAHMAGFKVAVAFDIDPILSSSYSTNFPHTKVVQHDVAVLTGDDVQREAGGPVDGLFGGPPCQGFSDIGRRDITDVRRRLLWHFFRLVREVQPTFFVMENVRGLLYPENIGELEAAIAQVSDEYEISDPIVWDASQFGAATKRNRLFVVGVHKDRGDRVANEDIAVWKRPAATVRQALADIGGATFLSDDDYGFDWWRIEKRGRPHSYARDLRLRSGNRAGCFTGHRKTRHTDKVIERFAIIPQGGFEKVGRHPRLAWDGQCPTLRAGTGADLGSFQSVRPIHPEEHRVITVREGARLQGFPDGHLFHPTVWHSFRMIGNSVSPIMAQAVFNAVAAKLDWAPTREDTYPLAAE
ncbi:MAG: DNA cytosine methyltransferase [Alphaproteobacteria bacterium]|nr:MAG: DNA cytosine methyltransferase [Alphaproteobacteria bacterium]